MHSSIAVLGLLVLLPLGCQQASDPGPFDTAFALQQAGQADQASALLAAEDIEKCLRESSLVTLKMSEAEFATRSTSERTQGQEEMLLVVPFVKRAAYQQIETMQAAEEAGRSAKSKQVQEQIQRLINTLQDKNKVLLYQQLGSGIQKKLDQVSANNKTDKSESKSDD
ncbi:hypothetical protein CA11_58690 [Gimesia maris]|nr:hypothetical protein CA11_58690 [Gimesia maris]